MKERVPTTLSVVYDRVSGKPTITATGAFGGPSPDRHSIIAQLYIEHGSVPSVVTHSVRDDQTVDMEHGDPVSRGDITREIQGTLVLTPEAAVIIGKWLVNHGIAAIKGRSTLEQDGDTED